MMQDDNTALNDAAHRARGRDLVVLLAMAIVSIAVAAGLHVQRGVVLGPATLAALAMFAVFLASHFMFGRRSAPRAAARRPMRAPDRDRRMQFTSRHAAESAAAGPAISPPPTTPVSAGRLPMPPASASAAGRSAQADALPGYWNYAPGMPTLDMPPPPAPPLERATPPPPPFGVPSIGALPLTEPSARTEPVDDAPEAAGLREADVEVIQELIKKLADEVNAADFAQSSTPSTDVPEGPVSARPESMAADMAVETSLSALRVTAETMRAAQPSRASEPGPASDSATKQGLSALEAASARSRFASDTVSMPPPVNPAHARMASIAEAISAGRLDVFLQPILGLGNQRAGHYEVSFRLRSSNGEVIELGDEAEIARTGLLPLLDAAKISRAAMLAGRLGERGKTGSVFSGQRGESIADDTYLADVAAVLKARPINAGQLVMTFSQSDVRAFEAPEWSALADLNTLGFRFALSGITDLDMDFGALSKAGFGFAKLDADMFLEGLQAPEGLIPAADLCRHLADRGLTLVVEKIDDEHKLARIFGFGVLFGQGQLFGAPRPMKAEAVVGSRDAAA